MQKASTYKVHYSFLVAISVLPPCKRIPLNTVISTQPHPQGVIVFITSTYSYKYLPSILEGIATRFLLIQRFCGILHPPAE